MCVFLNRFMLSRQLLYSIFIRRANTKFRHPLLYTVAVGIVYNYYNGITGGIFQIIKHNVKISR
jgi:hypothetical protein